ncbi:MAG TPA: L-histidine N(alpha)-methyltransferase [Pseudonocardia sp.]
MNAGVLDIHLTDHDAEAALAADARAGLTASPKSLPPKWFYDARGSVLFEQITRLPEYYPTRTERALLIDGVDEIAALSGADTLVELGSGSSEKTRLLLDAFQRAGTLATYVPQDVSASALRAAMDALAPDYPGLALHGVVGDFTRHLDRLPRGGRRMIAFLGGTIGNLAPRERAAFLTRLRGVLAPGEQLLLGTSMVIDEPTMVAAYADSHGVTAEFNRNVLRVLNRELAADFAVDAFDHHALWDARHEWIEMRLRARHAMTVRVADLDLTVAFAEGEELTTETSAKFRPGGVRGWLEATGYDLTRTWTDAEGRHALTLATAA